MSINEILEECGWTVETIGDGYSVWDRRPQLKAAFGTNRIGKIVGTSFYVTLTQFPEVTKGLIRQLGCEPVQLPSRNQTRDAIYFGFNTNGIPTENLRTFARRLAAEINDLL
jgi:hypothetical protein